VKIFSGRASFSIILATEPIIEQDHRFIKKVTKPIMGFKAFHSAQAAIAEIDTAHMIRKGQYSCL
jgi:transposase-like protein